jgi:hypothetical protein
MLGMLVGGLQQQSTGFLLFCECALPRCVLDGGRNEHHMHHQLVLRQQGNEMGCSWQLAALRCCRSVCSKPQVRQGFLHMLLAHCLVMCVMPKFLGRLQQQECVFFVFICSPVSVCCLVGVLERSAGEWAAAGGWLHCGAAGTTAGGGR